MTDTCKHVRAPLDPSWCLHCGSKIGLLDTYYERPAEAANAMREIFDHALDVRHDKRSPESLRMKIESYGKGPWQKLLQELIARSGYPYQAWGRSILELASRS